VQDHDRRGQSFCPRNFQPTATNLPDGFRIVKNAPVRDSRTGNYTFNPAYNRGACWYGYHFEGSPLEAGVFIATIGGTDALGREILPVRALFCIWPAEEDATPEADRDTHVECINTHNREMANSREVINP